MCVSGYVLQLKDVMTAVAAVRSSVANQLADRIGGASAMGGAEIPLKTIETSTTAPCHCFGTGRRRNTPQMLSRTQPLTIDSRAPRVSSNHAQNGMVTVNAMPAVLACAPMSASDQPYTCLIGCDILAAARRSRSSALRRASYLWHACGEERCARGRIEWRFLTGSSSSTLLTG